MNRREALSYTAAVLGTSLIGGQAFLTGCTPPKDQPVPGKFNVALLDEIGEQIFPKTEKSPGAKDVKIGEFMKTIVTECYSAEEEAVFIHGIDNLQQRSRDKFGNDFLDISAADQLNLLKEIDYEATNSENPDSHYFTMVRQLTIWGYFSSEPGATKALRYIQTPGRFDGCVPYSPGESAWAD